MSERWKDYWDVHARTVPRDQRYRRVLRVCQKQPIADALFRRVAAYVVSQLALAPDHVVLDLCCGNGLLSAALEPACGRVVGVDFCESLLADLPHHTAGRTLAVAGDALDASFTDASFDRVLIAAALQHFELGEAVRLLRIVASYLRRDGVLLVTDIPDAALLWRFFDDTDREDAHFQALAEGAGILGTWFDREWLTKLARHAGFRYALASGQPPDFLYAHYRFDLRCVR